MDTAVAIIKPSTKTNLKKVEIIMTKMAELAPKYIFDIETDEYEAAEPEIYQRSYYDFSRNYEEAC